jgi:hypothetical protein
MAARKRKKNAEGVEVVTAVVTSTEGEPLSTQQRVWPGKGPPSERTRYWKIVRSDGAVLGEVPALTREGALDSFARECGFTSARDAEVQAGAFDGTVVEVSAPSATENPSPPTYKGSHWGLEPTTDAKRDVPEPGDNAKLIGLGELVSVTYRTKKKGDRRDTDYVHKFEKTRPVLAYGDKDGRLFIAGGDYKVEARGIVK